MMATATQEKINLLDNVCVWPTEDSAHDVKEFTGRQGTIYAHVGDDLCVVFEHGVRLCLSPAEVRVCSRWEERIEEKTADRRWRERQ